MLGHRFSRALWPPVERVAAEHGFSFFPSRPIAWADLVGRLLRGLAWTMHDGFRRLRVYAHVLVRPSILPSTRQRRFRRRPGNESRSDAVSTQHIPSWCPRGIMAAGGDVEASPTDDFLTASPTPATQIRSTSCGPPREALPVKDSGIPEGEPNQRTTTRSPDARGRYHRLMADDSPVLASLFTCPLARRILWDLPVRSLALPP